MPPSASPDETVDYYTLLSIPQSSTEAEIRRAYRITSRLYHPDKVTPTPETLEKFQQLQQALSTLTDPAERASYDAKREAKLRRAAETAAMDSRRRKMVEDLERRESDARSHGGGGGGAGQNGGGVKRTWSERELEIRRIAEENRRKREEVVARKMEEEVKRRAAQAEKVVVRSVGGEGDGEGAAGDEIQRSVKVRWVKEAEGLEIDEDALMDMFPAGEVESVVVLKDKKRKVEGRERKVVMGTAVLVFKSLAAAKGVVAKGRTDELESVVWAVEKEKDPL